MRNIWRIFLLIVMIVGVNLPFGSVGFAAFEPLRSLEGVAVCEVAGYGEQSLKKEFLAIFRDLLSEKIQETKLVRVERILRNQTADEQNLSKIHMQAIVCNDDFEEEKANMELYKYWEAQKKEEIEEDNLTSSQKAWIRKFGIKNNVKYLVFCNVKEIDVKVRRNGSIVSEDELRKMKLKLDVDYCVIECQTGKINRGNSFTDKSMGIVDLLIVKYGKKVTIQQLLHMIFDKQATRISEDIIDIVT